MTFGITPTHPETGFGYIECGEMLTPPMGRCPPLIARGASSKSRALALAREYLAAGRYVWNSGMFAFTADAILDAFARHAPGVLDACIASRSR